MFMAQLQLLGREEVAIDREFRALRRFELGMGAWVDYQPNWLSGHLSLFDQVHDGLAWRHERRVMYDREVMVPRLVAMGSVIASTHPAVGAAMLALSMHYRRDISSLGAAYYRDGQDSVAPHSDRMGPMSNDCIVAIVALGAGRKFQVRPKSLGDKEARLAARALDFTTGFGDLW